MAEWLKAHAWKACLGETLTRVRIPLSPPVTRVSLRRPVRSAKCRSACRTFSQFSVPGARQRAWPASPIQRSAWFRLVSSVVSWTRFDQPRRIPGIIVHHPSIGHGWIELTEICPTPFKSPNNIRCRDGVSPLAYALSNAPHCNVGGWQGEIDDLDSVATRFPTLPSRKKAAAAKCALHIRIQQCRHIWEGTPAQTSSYPRHSGPR